ncbi:MAG TPA: Spi family protease inhibitor [Bacteroidales bacterium]|nr:Spi family protease inhibitor [Bacteroidales bacterium]
MKLKIYLILFIQILTIRFLIATEVPLETAKIVAKTIYLQMAPPTLGISTEDFVISEVFTSSQDGNLLYYVFNIGSGNGFVIITGQDNVIPVLGYSFKGKYKEIGHSPAYNEFMDFFKKQIIYAIDKNLQPTNEITAEWSRLSKGEINSQKSLLTSVGPLTETLWGQGCYYNSECPECQPPHYDCD